jgi:histidinol-phosphate phosphatase family protein
MIVSNVGGLPALVPHEKVGLVASPDPDSMAEAILRFFTLGASYFFPGLQNEKKTYSWSLLVETILLLGHPLVDDTWTLFLDRDGVLNVEKEGSYILHYGEFHFYEGVKEALRLLADKFGRIVVVTNQRGLGKSMMTAADLQDIHEKMIADIAEAGGRIDRVYFEDSLENDHPRRKPNPGMGHDAKHDLPNIDFSRSMMVGNNLSDMEFGRALGMYTIFIRTTHPDQPLPDPSIDLAFNSLYDFAKHLHTP